MPIAGRIPFTEGVEMMQNELVREAATIKLLVLK